MKKKTAERTALLLICLLLTAFFNAPVNAYPQGDVDGNGKVEAADARIALRSAVKLETLTSVKRARADMDGDGVVTTADARSILRIAVGLNAAEKNEYDILRSGTYYFKGRITENGSSETVEIAETPSGVYMSGSIDGLNIGILRKSGTVYFVYPEKKAAMKLTSALMNMMDITEEDLEFDTGLSFSSLPSLSDAKKTASAKLNGIACTVYTFTLSGETVSIYMNGSKIVRAVTESAGTKTVIDFTSVSDTVPPEMISVPSGWLMSYLRFFALLAL